MRLTASSLLRVLTYLGVLGGYSGYDKHSEMPQASALSHSQGAFGSVAATDHRVPTLGLHSTVCGHAG